MVDDAEGRLKEHACNWNVQVEHVRATTTSVLGFGAREGEAVVLKVARTNGDEWNTGTIAAAFQGRGMVNVLIHTPGAMLMEWLRPGASLVYIAADDDDAAARIIAELIRAMQPTQPISGTPTAEQWGTAFDRYLAGSNREIPPALVIEARDRYFRLCETQKERLLLHGDLQHYNILSSGSGRWTAIDPKGVIGEIEFEVAASLRNPQSHRECYSDRDRVRNRIELFARHLKVDATRLTEWAFAQAILSAVWTCEDEGTIHSQNPALLLAAAARSLLA
ncbi:MAG TPA: aminoglycoside phosphotransferase family protein [Longimicrobiales bacterium]|nr:aminoglycoside phosphotransferase family protein [Longimicrobiales bacterium]